METNAERANAPTRQRANALWGRVLTNGSELPPSRVLIADGGILAVESAPAPLPGDIVVDDGWIAPGFIDLQVNGAAGADLTSAPDPAAALHQVAQALARKGVTSFCPTIVSSPCEVILDRLAAYQLQTVPGGAEVLGAHVEGPFIDPGHRGVHDPRDLRLPTQAEVAAWIRAGPPAIVTLAPELSGALDAVVWLCDAGVRVSLGHSAADANEARAGLANGARMATHLFNAMPPLHHRQPGLVGALLASDAVLGMIADGVHIDPLVVDLVIRRAGCDRVALVSDALAAAGAPPGRSVLGDQVVESDGRVVRRLDGTLAGSAMLLDECVRNVRAWLPDLPAGALIDMATRTPASLLGLSRKGRVARGCDADLVVLDAAFRVRLACVRGDVVKNAL